MAVFTATTSGSFSFSGSSLNNHIQSYNPEAVKIFDSADFGLVTQSPVYDPIYGDWNNTGFYNVDGELNFEQLVGFGYTVTTYPLSFGVALTFAEQSQDDEIDVFGVDFVTNSVDKGNISPNHNVQWNTYCNAVGITSVATGRYFTQNQFVFAYQSSVGAAASTAFTYFTNNAVLGRKDYVNFATGVAAKWSSAYKVASVTPLSGISSLSLLEEYSYAPFNYGGQKGFVFKVPDNLPTTNTGTLGNINANPAPFELSGNLIHPDIDYTPHYGIEKNIGIGTVGFQLSASVYAIRRYDYVGSGALTGLSGAAESTTKVYDLYDFIIVDEQDWGLLGGVVPYNGYDDYGVVTILHDPVEIWGPIVGYGSSTIFPFGKFNIVNGLSPQESYPWLPEPGVGRSWSFAKGNYTASGPAITLVSNAGIVTSTLELNIYGVDFITGYVDSGVLSSNWLAQWRLYCNATGFGGGSDGNYIVIDDYAVTYVSNVAGQTVLNNFLSNAIVGTKDYVNFSSGPAAKWSSAYKLETLTPLTSLSQLTEQYSYAPFQIAGQAGIAFKLPDFVAESTGSLGNINQLYSSTRISGELVHPNIDLTPHYGIEKNIGIGTTGIQITGISSGIESVEFNPPENTSLFIFSGQLIEKFAPNPPENTQLFTYSGFITEKHTESWLGLGTATFSGTAIEKVSFDTPDNTQLFNISGIASCKEIQVYGINPGNHPFPGPPDFSGGLITISGELLHPNIDFTPHYGIEKNIGIGTTGIQFRVGVGTFPDSEGVPRDARTYSNVYPRNDKVPLTGVGTFTFDQVNDLAKYSPLTPYTGIGTFRVSTGLSPQESYPWLPGPGVGRSWNYARTSYITSGSLFTPTSAITQEVNVYGQYGDLKTPGTSGLITISGNAVERDLENYIGSGIIYIGKSRTTLDSTSQTFDQTALTFDVDGTEFIYTQAIYSETDAYEGSGTLFEFSGGTESYSAQTPEDTILFTIFGSADEAYSAQTPEQEVLYAFNGSIEISSTKSEVSVGITLITSGESTIIAIRNYLGLGTLRVVTHLCDNEYDTCDQEIFTSDYETTANISFSANPPENTQLFSISGNAVTRPSTITTYDGVASDITLYASASSIKQTFAYNATGTISKLESSSSSEANTYIGNGTIFVLRGSSQAISYQPTEDTALYTILGSASTRLQSSYPIVGIGLFAISGESSDRKIAVYTQLGTGIITLSGNLVYPDIIYIPSPDGSGFATFNGSADNSIFKNYDVSSGSLFAISGGTEAISYATYVGIGNITIQSIASITELNEFQPSRTYVVII